jgi:hypothetical protein
MSGVALPPGCRLSSLMNRSHQPTRESVDRGLAKRLCPMEQHAFQFPLLTCRVQFDWVVGMDIVAEVVIQVDTGGAGTHTGHTRLSRRSC